MKFDINKVKPDFSNVRTIHGDKIIYLHDTGLKMAQPIIIQPAGCDYVTCYPVECLVIDDEPKLIDWSKLPVGTLVAVKATGIRHLNSEGRAIVNGRSPLTGDGPTYDDYKSMKLIENPNFTYWPGGDCPVPEGVRVEVVLRNGQELDHWHDDYDIIAYRILGAADGYSHFFQGREF